MPANFSLIYGRAIFKFVAALLEFCGSSNSSSVRYGSKRNKSFLVSMPCSSAPIKDRGSGEKRTYETVSLTLKPISELSFSPI